MPKINVDFRNLLSQLQPVLLSAVDGILEGGADDLQNFVLAIANDVARAGEVEDDQARASLLDELTGQFKTVAEINKLRVVNAEWNSAMKAINVVVNTLVAVGRAAI